MGMAVVGSGVTDTGLSLPASQPTLRPLHKLEFHEPPESGPEPPPFYTIQGTAYLRAVSGVYGSCVKLARTILPLPTRY